MRREAFKFWDLVRLILEIYGSLPTHICVTRHTHARHFAMITSYYENAFHITHAICRTSMDPHHKGPLPPHVCSVASLNKLWKKSSWLWFETTLRPCDVTVREGVSKILLCIVRVHSVYVSSQWQMALHCDAVSHWLIIEWSLQSSY